MRIDPVRRAISQDPKDDAFVQNPYAAYGAMRDLGGAFVWEEYGIRCYARFADVNALLRDRGFGRDLSHVATRAELGWPEEPPHLEPFTAFLAHSMLEREPPAHTRLRGLINRAFLARHVERLRPRIAAIASELIDRVEAGGGCDLLKTFCEPIPVIVIAELLGIPPDMAPQLLDWSHRMVAMHQFGRTRETEDSACAATTAFADYVRGFARVRRAKPGDDLISLLLAAEAEGDRLTEDELVYNVIQLLNAGHEATVHAMGNAVALMLREKTDPAAAFATEDATLRLVEETLRFDPPLHLFTRYALADCERDGVHYRKGEQIGLLLGAANRDPARWADAERFEPARPIETNVAFGAGIHFCVGAPLARLELAVALPILFRRLSGLRLAGPPRYRDSYHFHGLARLDVVW